MSVIRRATVVGTLVALLATAGVSGQYLLTGGIEGAWGSTVGPDGALYVTEGAPGRVSRVHPWTGATMPYWEGLPSTLPWVGVGGVVDVAFLDGVAYALVTLVGTDLGGSDVVGIYRMEGTASHSIVADLGSWSDDNPPPDTDFFIDTGVQYAMEVFRGGFLVTDGHHNRLLWVSRHGEIHQLRQFGNVVPTGLEVRGKTIFMGELGPAPNDPEDGKVVAIDASSLDSWLVGSGARMVVDVELGLGNTLYALGQGEWDGVGEGSPAFPETGSLVEIEADGSFTVIADGLDRPTSMELIGNSVYIVSLAGDIWVIDDVSDPPFGR